MQAPHENKHSLDQLEERQSLAAASSGVGGSKDGRGIGHLVNLETIAGWLENYLQSRPYPEDLEPHALLSAFEFGVRAEYRYPSQSFIEAEPDLRSEWSSERGHLPWESVRDAIWSGFDRARDRNMSIAG